MDHKQPLTRRTFVLDVLAMGAGLVGAVAWGILGRSAPEADAAPSSPSPRKKKPTSAPKPPPRERDNPPLGGKPQMPPSPRPTPKPREQDHRPAPGSVPAPIPKPKK